VDRIKYNKNLVVLLGRILAMVYFVLIEDLLINELGGFLKKKLSKIKSNFSKNTKSQLTLRIINHLFDWYHIGKLIYGSNNYFLPESGIQLLVLCPLYGYIFLSIFYNLEFDWEDYKKNFYFATIIDSSVMSLSAMLCLNKTISYVIGYLLLNYEIFKPLTIIPVKHSYYFTGLIYKSLIFGIYEELIKKILEIIKKIGKKKRKKEGVINHGCYWDFSKKPKDENYGYKNNDLSCSICENILTPDSVFTPCYSCKTLYHANCFDESIKIKEKKRGYITRCLNCNKNTYYYKTWLFVTKIWLVVIWSILEDLIHVYLYIEILSGNNYIFNRWYDQILALFYVVFRCSNIHLFVRAIISRSQLSNIIINNDDKIPTDPDAIADDNNFYEYHFTNGLCIFFVGPWNHISNYLEKNKIIPKYIWSELYECLTNYPSFIIWNHLISKYYQNQLTYIETKMFFNRICAISGLSYIVLFIFYISLKFITNNVTDRHVIKSE